MTSRRHAGPAASAPGSWPRRPTRRATRGAAVLRVDCWAGAPPLVAWYERQGFAALGDVRRRRLDRPGLHDAAVTYDPPVVVRIAIVAVAVAAIVLLASRLRDHDRCDSALAAVATHVGALTSSCRDPDVVAGASAQLLTAGRRDAGLRLARESVRREPAELHRLGRPRAGAARARSRRVATRAGAREGAQPALAGTAVDGLLSVAGAGGGRRRSLKRRIGRSTR